MLYLCVCVCVRVHVCMRKILKVLPTKPLVTGAQELFFFSFFLTLFLCNCMLLLLGKCGCPSKKPWRHDEVSLSIPEVCAPRAPLLRVAQPRGYPASPRSSPPRSPGPAPAPRGGAEMAAGWRWGCEWVCVRGRERDKSETFEQDPPLPFLLQFPGMQQTELVCFFAFFF